MRKPFPLEGRPAASVLSDLEAMKAADADWRGGRVPLYVFKASDAVDALGQAAFMSFFSENALGARRCRPAETGTARSGGPPVSAATSCCPRPRIPPSTRARG